MSGADPVSQKYEEIRRDLVGATGVDEQDVDKILNQFGLKTALEHRLMAEGLAKNYGLPAGSVIPLANVNFNNLRVAAGGGHI